jgi:hypothetical protein
MATSKSTVVGIRLDHERRAWVEAEAARLGVSIRGLFEGMIDEARAIDQADASRAIAGLGSVAPDPVATEGFQTPGAVSTGTMSGDAEGQSGVNAAPTSAPSSSRWPDLGSATAVPGGLIREALSLTASLIELGGRCATRQLESCVLTRHVRKRSV